MNEGEFSGGQVQPTPNDQGNMPEQSADTANQAILSSASAGDTESAKSLFSNSNSFDAPQGTISSSADPDDDGPSTGHLFGSRSRRGSSRRSPAAEAQPFVPNPNAPDFFNDAMASMTPAPQPRSNKNGLKIAIIAVVAVLVIGGGILAAVLLGKGGGGGDKPSTAEAELAKIIEEGSDSVAYFDDELATIADESELQVVRSVYDSEGKSIQDENLKDLNTKYEELKTFEEKLNGYNKNLSSNPKGEEIQEKLNTLKSTLAASMSSYEKIYKINKTILSALIDKGETKVTPVLSQYSNDAGVLLFASTLDTNISKRATNKTIIEEKTCFSRTTDPVSCRSAITAYNEANDAISGLDSQIVCEKIFNDSAALSRRGIYQQMSSLMGLVQPEESSNE